MDSSAHSLTKCRVSLLGRAPNVLALAGILALPAAAAARGDDDYSAAYRRCMAASGGVTASMLDCGSDEHAEQDRRLNDTYRALIATLSAERSAQLREAQRAWLRFRDENCAWYADAGGGTAASLAASSCMLEMTKSRADEIARFLAAP